MIWGITNSTYVNYNNIQRDFQCLIENEKFIKVGSKDPEMIINLHGRVLMPSFINAFDNLLATYLPYKGKNFPYINWLTWDNEIKSSNLFQERMLLSKEDLYFLGSYKNIFSGVTFVVDHIPQFVFSDILSDLDIDLLENFGISHSPVSYALNWGRGIKYEYKYAIENNLPFIIRVGEGLDKESKLSIKKLEELEVLGRNTVLIHGVFLDEEDLEIIKKYGCYLVWCPEVNEFIYGKTAPIQRIVEKGIKVTIGSGSSMNGNINFLSNLKVAKKYIDSSSLLMEFLFKNNIESFFLNDMGKIEENFYANFIVLDKISVKNFDFIFDINQEDIQLVVRKGKPIFGGYFFKNLFDFFNIEIEEIEINRKKFLVKKDFIMKLNQVYLKLGKRIDFPFFNNFKFVK